MNTRGPAFPVPDSHHANGQVQYGANGMTLLDWMAGQALVAIPHIGCGSDLQPEQIAHDAYTISAAMLAEKARREADHSEDTLGMIPHREVDNDYWAKFQDGILISFEPTHGWCATIRDGSMGWGNTIAEAVENLRVRWEEKNVVPVVQDSSTTDHSPDAGKMDALESANRELVEALEGCNYAFGRHCPDEDSTYGEAWAAVRSALTRHKGPHE